MDFAPLLAALALMVKLVDFAKFLRARDANAIVTQLAVWVAGVAVTLLLAASDFAAAVEIGDGLSLAKLNAASLALIGLTISSTGSVVYDFKKAADNTDSATVPSLVPHSGGTPSR